MAQPVLASCARVFAQMFEHLPGGVGIPRRAPACDVGRTDMGWPLVFLGANSRGPSGQTRLAEHLRPSYRRL